MRLKVFAFFAIWFGASLVVVSLDQGFGLEAAWYWWVLLGVGLGAVGAAWNDL
jgi:hypothetical protein